MTALLAAMLVLMDAGSLGKPPAPSTSLTVRALAAPARTTPPLAALQGCDRQECRLAPVTAPAADPIGILGARPQELLSAATGRLNTEFPLTAAALWIATSGFQLDLTPRRVYISVRIPGPG